VPSALAGLSPSNFRGLLAQPLLWRLGLHTASTSTNSSSPLAPLPHHLPLLTALRTTNLSSCTSNPSCLLHLYSSHLPSALTMVEAWLEDLAALNYTFPILRPHRRFAHLTQGAALTTTSLPRLRGGGDLADVDTFYLSFKDPSGHLHFPNSSWQQGRNALLRLALTREVSPGYEYFIFTDEDVTLLAVNDTKLFWKPEVPTNPWNRLEEFLLDLRPYGGFGRYDGWRQVSGVPEQPYTVTSTHDQCMVAYSRRALQFGLPLTESPLDWLSSWNQALVLYFKEKVFYSRSLFQINSIITENGGSAYHAKDLSSGGSYQYKQGFNFKEVQALIESNMNPAIQENPVLELINQLFENMRSQSEFRYGEMSLDVKKFNFSERAQMTFGKTFEPEMLKYFNICGSMLQTQFKWYRSELLRDLPNKKFHVSEDNRNKC